MSAIYILQIVGLVLLFMAAIDWPDGKAVRLMAGGLFLIYLALLIQGR